MGVKREYDSPIVDDEDFMEESDDEFMEEEDENEDELEENPKGVPMKRFRQVVHKSRDLDEQLKAALKRLEKLETPPSNEKDELDDLEDENARALFKKRFEKVERKYASRLEALEKQIRRQEAALANPELRENSSAIEKMRRHYLNKSGVDLPDDVLLDLIKRNKPRKQSQEEMEDIPATRQNVQRRVPLGNGGLVNKSPEKKKKDPLSDFKF